MNFYNWYRLIISIRRISKREILTLKKKMKMILKLQKIKIKLGFLYNYLIIFAWTFYLNIEIMILFASFYFTEGNMISCFSWQDGGMRSKKIFVTNWKNNKATPMKVTKLLRNNWINKKNKEMNGFTGLLNISKK